MDASCAISALAKRYGISRSTLLHYDRIGLLHPSGRSAAGYRRYTAADDERLHRILVFRRAGVPLPRVGELLEVSSESASRDILRAHLDGLIRQSCELQAQQNRVLALLGSEFLPNAPRLLSRTAMVSVFRAAGLDDEGMHRLHVHFEKADPAAHQRFLESLGLDDVQIAKLREESREYDGSSAGAGPRPP